MTRWGMTIDLNRCVGCQTCTIACKHANDTTPDVQWRRVLDVETGTFPDVARLFLVTGCQHCAEPPCVPVCPTGATRQRADGLVTMDYDLCIGCAYCAVSCPYQARTIVHDASFGYFGAKTLQETATAHPERQGVAQKCTFCITKVDDGLARGLKPGVDLEATPACAASCISQAIQFGDFNDPRSHVATLARENEHFQMHAELGTDPQIKYLYTTLAVPGREPAPADIDDERMSDPANPLVGPLQPFWDWRAAMNWVFGGMSSGYATLIGLGTLGGWMTYEAAPGYFMLAAALMAVGLFFVFLKIGRQLRFWRAVSRPQTSWMTRELYAVAVFYAAVLAMFVGGVRGPTVVAIATLGAVAFLVSQAKILHRARGIPAWRVPLMPAMIVASGIAEGFGLMLIVPGLPISATVIAGAIALALVNAALWWRYAATARAEGVGPRARDVLDRLTPVLHALGHAAPIALLFIAPAVAGLAFIAGGALWKYGVIVRAGYQQGFALAKLPRRGSGSLAAPVRLAGR